MIRAVLITVMVFTLAACSSKFQSYDGPEVTQIHVFKEDRKMYLMHGNQVLKAYDIGLGNAPAGPKRFEGDGKTPEGTYRIDRRNPNSTYHLSIGISYPNVNDMAFAQSQGRSPGGDIFIHGEDQKSKRGGDWTAGCIAVSDDEIEEIYAMVHDGTIISIHP